MQQAILNARHTIIYSTSWTVDGQGEYVRPDGTVEKLPEFSDLFPGWDLPRMDEPSRIRFLEGMEAMKATKTEVTSGAEFFGNVYLFAPPSSGLTPSFYGFYKGLANAAKLSAQALTGSTYNAGFTNINTGTDIVNKTNMSVNGYVRLTNMQSDVSYGARASTYSTEGYALLSVLDD
jgi:hypothetical protein